MKKHIDELKLHEINHAVAIAQGWKYLDDSDGLRAEYAIKNSTDCYIASEYQPTTNQAQCGELMDKVGINTRKRYFSPTKSDWSADIRGEFLQADESRLIAACKAFLWSVYPPDGMVEI